MIITISREFGSGGRELGKRLADELGIPCYDKEIISMIAENQGFDENYVSYISETSIRETYPVTIGNHFFTTGLSYATQQAIKINAEQTKIIENFAKQGDCVIIGRCADIILKEYNSFNIFVYAHMDAKVKRCKERNSENESWTDKELVRKIREVDKNRAKYRSIYADTKWGDRENYNLCVNTTNVEIKTIVPSLAQYIKTWFEQNK